MSAKTNGFIMVTRDILGREDINSTAKLVYAYIVDAMRGKTYSYPGVRTVAAGLGMHRETVGLAVNSLVEAKMLIVGDRSNGQRNTYRLPCETGTETTPDVSEDEKHKPVEDSDRSKTDKAVGISGRLPANDDNTEKPKAVGISDSTGRKTRPEAVGESDRKKTKTKKKTRTHMRAAPADVSKPRDQIWNALAEVWKAPTTKSGKSFWGRTVTELIEAKVTAAEVVLRGRRCLDKYGDKASPAALCKHWDELDHEETKTDRHDRVAVDSTKYDARPVRKIANIAC